MVASVARVESVTENAMENATRSALSALNALSVAENTVEVIVAVRFAHKGRYSSSISNMIY
jgi:hypothetical protein